MGMVTKSQILANDMVRRLLNTGEGLPNSEIVKVVDGYAVKLMKSGHKKDKVKEIVLAGIRGYEKKKRRCHQLLGGLQARAHGAKGLLRHHGGKNKGSVK